MNIVNRDKHRILEKNQQAITLEQLQQIKEFANSIRYGSITLIFQDGVLIQIEKHEKIRISTK